MLLFRYIANAYDFFAKPYYRYIGRRKYLERVTLTAEGFAYLTVASFITIGSVLRNVNLLILMTGIMFAPLFINWRLAVHRVRSLRGRRQLPSRINANQMISVQWHCENGSRSVPAMNVIVKDRICRAPDESQTLSHDTQQTKASQSKTNQRFLGELRDRLFGRSIDGSVAEPLVRFQRIVPGRSEIQTYRAFFPQRGKYLLGPAEIDCSFPFGLILSRQRIGQECEVLVGPELGVLCPTWEKRLNSTAKGADSVRRSRAIEDDDFFALRRWRSGDSRKNIHWRSTAKQRFPIVKQFVERNNRDFALVLDLFVDDDDQPQARQDCESVLSFAATTLLSVKSIIEGQAAIAVCGQTRELSRSKTVGGLVADAMPALAVAAGHPSPAIVEGVVSCLESVSRGTPIYVISSREMPAHLQSGLQAEADSDDARSRYTARRMRIGLPMVRWLNVQSTEFKEIFSIDKKQPRRKPKISTGDRQFEMDSKQNGQKGTEQKSDDRRAMPSDLAELSQNWIDRAKS
ncbi:DUF58 domain-containing protein [Mariniblastus sp.]|nr:DUF58 domain-containing protein [Mariniblastus sp.]